MGRNRRRQLTFEDSEGQRAEGYIRDSTLDQKDGFGPETQRRSIESFARMYGLILGDAWYTDFITGTSTIKRSGFQQSLEDAQVDRFDVLLVYNTSRFARNRGDAVSYKDELRRLGKSLVFVSQGIISGNDNQFLNEDVNEVLDEQYSRNLSVYVEDGCWTKHEQGLANGVPPLGYRSEKLENGKRERKVPDQRGIGHNPKAGGMEALLALLQGYASGQYSYRTLAEVLNTKGYRNRVGKPFTKGSVEHVLHNRFYEGKAVNHPGESDEEVRDGVHEVPEEVKELWLKCQIVRQQQTREKKGRPRHPNRPYPFTRVAVCESCGLPYGGQPVLQKSGDVFRRLYHKRPFCDLSPHSVRVEHLMSQFQVGVLPYITLGQNWEAAVVRSLSQETAPPTSDQEKVCLERALANLRKQHLWGDITDEEYRQERRALDRQLKTLTSNKTQVHLPNLKKAAELMSDLPALWTHRGVTDYQRESFIGEIFEQVYVRSKGLTANSYKAEGQL